MTRTLLFAGGLFILLVFGFTGKAYTVPPLTPDFNHFKCYEAEAISPPAPEEDTPVFSGIFADQFETRTEDVFTPDLFCNPVDKDGDGLGFADDGGTMVPNNLGGPTNHLLCYKISSELPRSIFVNVRNQFTNGIVEVEDSELLCVPTVKLGCFVDEDEEAVGECEPDD